MRTYLRDTIKPLIPETVRNAIVPVSKVQSTYDSAVVVNGQTTTDDVWIPSNHEVFTAETTYESTGAVYSGKFSDNTSLIKNRNGSVGYWWLRSASSAGSFRYVYSDGSSHSNLANFTYGVTLGFCT